MSLLSFKALNVAPYESRIVVATVAAAFIGLPAPGPAQTTDIRYQGAVHRSAKAKYDFRRLHPCPATGKTKGSCPGYVIDHAVPLKRGGADEPTNMQWQTVEEAKQKDKWE